MKLQFSYSSLKKFITCPRQYAAVKVRKTYADVPGEEALYGKEVHAAFENYVLHKTPLPLLYNKFKPILDSLLEIPGSKYTELEVALDHEKRACDFNSPDYYVRGIIDLLILDEETGYILDYKTGNNRYVDVKQLRLLSLIIFHTLPQIQKIKAGLIFIAFNDFKPEEYQREEIPALWHGFAGDIKRLEHSYRENYWPENPSGLCRKWCPDLSCKHNGKGR